MHAVALLMSIVALGADGVQYGWEPAEDGHLVYIIQIAPDLVETLQKGDVDLQTDIPAELQPHIKKIKVRIGTGVVPRKGLEEAQAAAEAAAFKAAQENLNSTRAGGFKPGGKLNTTDPRTSPTAPGGRVLSPLNPNESPLPNENDRFTEGAASTFPTIGTKPGIGRMASTTRDAQGKFDTAPGDRTPLEYDTQGNPRTAPPAGATWDPVSRQYIMPDGKPATYPLDNTRVTDPRYNPGYPPAGYNQGATNYNQPRTAPGQWNQPYYPAPLRDPDGYYPPNTYPPNYAARPEGYDPNYPNRPAGYEQVASRPNTAGTNPNTAAGTTATPVANGPNASKTGVTPTSARDVIPHEDRPVPYGPLTVTAMLLFASIGLNFYLGWIAHGIYQRYRALLTEVRNVRVAVT